MADGIEDVGVNVRSGRSTPMTFPLIIGDKLINPIVTVSIPIVRIPIKGGMSLSPIKRDNLDHGTNDELTPGTTSDDEELFGDD